jgi:hypothetical protein
VAVVVWFFLLIIILYQPSCFVYSPIVPPKTQTGAHTTLGPKLFMSNIRQLYASLLFGLVQVQNLSFN